MILRRLAAAIMRQDWTAVVIEIAIVVIGVFLGIQLGNWNDARISDRKEIAYLQRLHEDVVRSRLALEADYAAAVRQYTDQEFMVDHLTSCALPTDNVDRFDRGLLWLGKINPPRFDVRTYQELISTGDLNLIDDDQIKDGLAEIVEDIALRSAVTETIYRRLEPNIVVVESHVQFNLPVGYEYDDGSAVDAVTVDYDLDEMCGDERVRRAISSIAAMTFERAQTFPAMLEKINSLDATISEVLGPSRLTRTSQLPEAEQ